MKWLRNFTENNAKIIEVTFSFISLVIVGVFGTTISINNSITSRASLELSRANAQPVFNIRSEYTYSDTNNEERLIVSIEGGFAENLNIVEYTWIEMYKSQDKEDIKKCVLTDYFVTNYYSGNNRGDVFNLTNTNNLTSYANLLKSQYDPNFVYNRFYKLTILGISYSDVTGKDLIRYYETNGTYFKHIENEKAKSIIDALGNIPSLTINELSIEKLNSLYN
jgi:hypothetical protein